MTMLSNEEAIATVKDLGRIFVQALFDKVGKKPKSKSELMNGLVAYEQLNLKGEFENLDKSVEIVLRLVCEEMCKRVEEDDLGIGRN
jgi:hypothetical protein